MKPLWKVDLGILIILAALFMLVYALSGPLTPFVVAGVFSYALSPAVNSLVKRKVPRGAAVALFVVLFFLAMAGAVALAAYITQVEIRALIENIPGYLITVDTRYLPVIKERLGISSNLNLQVIANQLRDKLVHMSPESMSSAAEYALSLLSGTVGFFMAVLNVVLIPVLMAYILLDYERMKSALHGYLPHSYKKQILDKLGEVEKVLRDFAKGQLLVATIMGVLYSAGLWAAGVEMPVLVGMGSGMLNLVPYLGTTIGLVVAAVLVLLRFQDLMHPAMVLAVFAVVQGLEGYVITPKVVGEKLGLHPIAIFLALMVFGELLGFIGILLAVPMAAVLKVFVSGFLRDYKASKLYAGE